jgi:KaiC/GvpD/RAD55 family RecA-like ATPase
MERVKSGVKGFDDLIGGGYPKGFAILVSGSPGCGKTIFGLHFLFDGMKKGEKCAYVTYSQSRKDLLDQAIQFGWDMKGVDFVEVKPEDFMEVVINKKYDRMVIDSLSSVAVMTRDSLGNFMAKLKGMGCTALLISELPKESNWLSRDTISEFMCDGVVILKSVEAAGEVKNLLKVEKMRSTKIDKESHIYNITESGFELKVYKAR